MTAADLANALFRGIAEVFLQDSLWTDVVFAIAILVNSRTCVVFALLGSALGGMTALVLGADGAAIYHGLYGFNAVLTGIALGGLFRVLEGQSTIYAFIGVIFSAIVLAVIAVALSPIGMPALTAPFVLTTGVFLLLMAGFRALERVSVAECASTKSLARLRTPESTRAE